MVKLSAGALCLATTLALATVTTADAAAVRIGTLTCELTGETNAIVYSTQDFDCNFAPTSGPREEYTGKIRQIGVDLEFVNTLTLVWAVLAPAASNDPGALAGEYVGAAASAAVGVGVGGRVLVGGFERSFTLQPLSVSGSTGGGADVGIERFTLTAR
ncbi:MAG: DUF992 domain-containing protein [Pseudomonadota bacterium]